MQKILITGATGFIGSHLIEQLRLFPQYEVIGTSDRKNILSQKDRGILICNLTNAKKVTNLLENTRPDLIIHLAAVLPQKIEFEFHSYRVNVLGTYNLLEAAQRVGTKKIFFASSINVYGKPQYYPIDEKHPRRPVGVYGFTKLLGESICQMFESGSDMKFVIMRFPGIYGMGRNTGIVFELAKKALRHQTIVAPSDGTDTFSVLHIEDAVRAIIQAVRFLSEGKGGIFNIGGNTVQGSNLAERIISYTQSKSHVRYERKVAAVHLSLDSQKASERLDFEPNNLGANLQSFISHLKTESPPLDKNQEGGWSIRRILAILAR